MAKRKFSLIQKDYQTINYVSGPLVFVENVKGVSYGEMVDIISTNGHKKRGQVLESSEKLAVVQVFEGTEGIDVDKTRVRFTEEVAKIDVSVDLLGRVLNGVGEPIDGGPKILPEERLEIIGAPINPYAREEPSDLFKQAFPVLMD